MRGSWEIATLGGHSRLAFVAMAFVLTATVPVVARGDEPADTEWVGKRVVTDFVANLKKPASLAYEIRGLVRFEKEEYDQADRQLHRSHSPRSQELRRLRSSWRRLDVENPARQGDRRFHRSDPAGSSNRSEYMPGVATSGS